MRIRGIVTLALLFFTPALAVKGQVHTGAVPADTAQANRIILLDPGLSLGRAMFLFPSPLGSELPFRDPSLMSPGGDWGPVGPFIGGAVEPRADLMYPLRLQMEKEKMSPFQRALGAIQVGAVGYMAYKHIKKYGLFR
jgi:hypothetical protein